MRILSRTSSAATLVALSLAACADLPGDEPGVAEDELSFQNYSLWKPAVPAIEFTGIKFCFQGKLATDAQYATFRRAVTDALKDWSNATDNYLRFGSVDQCGTGIQFRIENMDSNQGGHTKIGVNSEPVWINSDYVNDYAAVKDIALHEIGHKLGLTHEQVHRNSTCSQRQRESFLFWEWEGDTVGTSYFPYDANSVMNYCQPPNVGLSPGDIDGIQRLYGGKEYFLSDNRSFWLRSDHGNFMTGALSFNQGIMVDSLFHVTNVGKAGRDVLYGHQVAIRNSRGKYLRVGWTTSPKTGGLTTYSAGTADSPFAFDVSGFGRQGAEVNVNDPIAFSAVVSGKRLFLTASKNIKNGIVTLGASENASTTPPQQPGFVWRALGPGPDTPSVCQGQTSRCGDVCCGNGNTCQDASISLCCGTFEQRCGSVCCDLDQACVARRCEVQKAAPPKPSTTCGAFPACSTIDDCPVGYDYCTGCCRRLS